MGPISVFVLTPRSVPHILTHLRELLVSDNQGKGPSRDTPETSVPYTRLLRECGH